MRSTAGPNDPYLGKIYGHCRLERKLGEGGMGMVYLATHTTLRKLVAVKILRSDLCGDAHASDRFLREARSAARVEHPAVVQVHDIGQADGTFYIVMQYVEGITLEDRVKKHGPLPLSESLRIMMDICDGVREAHRQGIIHRDIKPDNILMGRDGSVKLVDFGLARAMEGDPNLSQTGRIFGTPHFMSPEQALGNSVDIRTDIYSLGATFYRIVTGRYPFQATTLMAVVYKLTHETAPSAREVNPSVPLDVSDLIRDMMARDVRRRIGSLDEVIGRLQAMESPEGGNGADDGAARKVLRKGTRKIRGPVHRHRALQRAFLGFLFLTILGSAAFLTAWFQGLVGPLRSLAARSNEPRQEPQKDTNATGAALAIKAAASLAAWENGAHQEPGETKPLPPGPIPPPSTSAGPLDPLPESTDPPAGQAAPPGPPPPLDMKKEREALESRVAAMLADVQADPDRITGYMAPLPAGAAEKAASAARRAFSFFFRYRPKNAPPLKAESMEITEEGTAADTVIRGVGRPFTLRWVKLDGQWYLSSTRARSGEKR